MKTSSANRRWAAIPSSLRRRRLPTVCHGPTLASSGMISVSWLANGLRHSSNRNLLGLFDDGRDGLHQPHQSRTLQDRSGQCVAGLDEQLGHRHLQCPLPGVQHAQRQVGRFAFLLPHLFDIDVQPSRECAARHSLLPAHRCQTLHRLAFHRRQRHVRRRPHACELAMSNAHDTNLLGLPVRTAKHTANRQDTRRNKQN